MRPGAATATIALTFLLGGGVGATHAAPRHKTPDKDSEEIKESKESTPWAEGVSEPAQQRALQLFREGNVFFEQSKYTEAVAKYERALANWDHPNIRFNMAVCLINMRQPLVAWNHLQRALRFGDAPLGKRLYTEAMSYTALLDASLASLTVTASQPEISVLVDGGQVLTGSGEHTIKLLAGRHQLVATRKGYETESKVLDLPAGKTTSEPVELHPEIVKVKVERENYERRWRWWIPWAFEAGTVALGLAGTAFYLEGRSEIRNYDSELARICPTGCAPSTIPHAESVREQHARRNSGIGIGLWAGAGAAAITGGVLAVLNRPRKIEEHEVLPQVTVSREFTGVGFSLTLK